MVREKRIRNRSLKRLWGRELRKYVWFAYHPDLIFIQDSKTGKWICKGKREKVEV